jgi:transcriptional regulator with XRE-family HTH domain
MERIHHFYEMTIDATIEVLLISNQQKPKCYMHKQRKSARCFLRTHRRNWGLTQRELASLIGTVSSMQVSRYENSKRAPKIEVALACQAIFGVPPSTMFPDAYALAEEEVMRNMYRMDQALKNTTSLLGLRKRELFALALERAVRKPKSFFEV